MYKCVLKYTRVYYGVTKCTKVYQRVLGCTKVYQSALGCTQVHQSLLVCTNVYQSVPESTRVMNLFLMPNRSDYYAALRHFSFIILTILHNVILILVNKRNKTTDVDLYTRTHETPLT